MTKDWRSQNTMTGLAGMCLGVVVALAMAAYAAWGALQEHAAECWPVAPGRLVSSVVCNEWEQRKSGQVLKYWVEVKYEYTVAGRTFIGGRVGLHDRGSNDQDEQVRLMTRLRETVPLGVRYSPDDPGHAVLVAGPTRDQAGLLLVALALLSFLAAIMTLENAEKRIAAGGAAADDRHLPGLWKARVLLVVLMLVTVGALGLAVLLARSGGEADAMVRSVVSG